MSLRGEIYHNSGLKTNEKGKRLLRKKAGGVALFAFVRLSPRTRAGPDIRVGSDEHFKYLAWEHRLALTILAT